MQLRLWGPYSHPKQECVVARSDPREGAIKGFFKEIPPLLSAPGKSIVEGGSTGMPRFRSIFLQPFAKIIIVTLIHNV